MVALPIFQSPNSIYEAVKLALLTHNNTGDFHVTNSNHYPKAYARDLPEFANPYPEEFGYLRIGTPVNADMNFLNYQCPGLDMGKLQDAGLLTIDLNTTTECKIQGNGYDHAAQDAWGFSLSAEAGLKTGYVDGAFSFHMALSRNVVSSIATQNLTAWAKQRGGIIMDLNVSEDRLLACSTEDFRNKIASIRTAEKPEDVTAAVAAFYAVYGTGFVSKLELGAMGIFKGEAKYTNVEDQWKASAGGGGTVGAPLIGASGAGEFTKQNMSLDVGGSFVAHSFGMPDASSSAQWAQGFVNQFGGAQLSKLGEQKAWDTAFNQKVAVAEKPVIPTRPQSKDPLPAYKLDNLKDALERMKMERFREAYKKQHGKEPGPKDYENQIKLLKELAEKNDNEINNSKEVNALAAIHTHAASPEPVTIHSLRDGVSFGGYGITGFEYTPWSDVLPKLKECEENLTLSQVTMGHAMVWLSIRGLFSQYLTFCAQYNVAPDGVDVAAIAYRLALDKMSNHILEALRGKKYNSDLLTSFEKTFRDFLKKERFQLFEHYQHLIDNYAWLKHVPFGAVAIVRIGDAHYFQIHGESGSKRLDSITDPGPTLVKKKAYRLYPILSTDKAGKPYFVWVGAWHHLTSGKEDVMSAPSLVNWTPHYQPGCSWASWEKMLQNVGMHYHLKSFEDAFQLARAGSEFVHILPEKQVVDERVWTLQRTVEGKSPDCHIFVVNGTRRIDMLALSGTGKDTIYVFSQSPEFKVEHADILLVPINYQTVKLGGGKVNAGGVPMWFEPRTDAILKKLNALAQPA